MATQSVRIPSVAATIRTYALRLLIGERLRRSQVLIQLVVIGVLVLAVPRFDSLDRPPLIAAAVILALIAASATYREFRFGAPARLVLAAGLTTFLIAIGGLAVVVLASRAFGPEPGSSLIDRLWQLPTDVLASISLGLAVLVVVVYWVRRPARASEEATFREQVRVERAARGMPPLD